MKIGVEIRGGGGGGGALPFSSCLARARVSSVNDEKLVFCKKRANYYNSVKYIWVKSDLFLFLSVI